MTWLAFIAIFGAGYFLGRENGIYSVERREARRRHVANMARRVGQQRGMATLDIVLWSVAASWAIVLLAARFGGS